MLDMAGKSHNVVVSEGKVSQVGKKVVITMPSLLTVLPPLAKGVPHGTLLRLGESPVSDYKESHNIFLSHFCPLGCPLSHLQTRTWFIPKSQKKLKRA